MRVAAQQVHDARGRPLGLKFALHPVHVGGGVGEEAAVAFAEVVEAGLSVGGAGETVFRTLAVAGEQPRTLAALARQGGALGLAEGALLGTVHEFDQGVVAQVAAAVFGEDEVVAGVG